MKLVQIQQTCGECPSQWEGYVIDRDRGERYIYIRYRHDVLTVDLDDVFGEQILCVEGPEGGDGNGLITWDSVIPILWSVDIDIDMDPNRAWGKPGYKDIPTFP